MSGIEAVLLHREEWHIIYVTVDQMDDLFGGLGGSGKGMSNYTLEEIEKAQKLKKKNGGTLMENLQKVTGKSLPTPKTGSSRMSAESLDYSMKAVSENVPEKNGKKSAGADYGSIRDTLMKNQEKLNQELEEYTKTLREDFDINSCIDDSWMRDFGLTREQAAGLAGGTTAKTSEPLSTSEFGKPTKEEQAETEKSAAEARAVSLDNFEGLAAEVCKTVYGQDEFVNKLVIAFKRPLVMPPEDTKALNSILLTGKNDTGKHFALAEVAKELSKRKILRNGDIRVMNLGIYTDASMEKLFLQDIYSSLSCSSRIILFENFESCHPSFLSLISSLVINGKFQLSERYILQNGQLVNVSNSLASEAVSAFTATGKYLVFLSEKSVDKTAGIMGAPFVNALGDICATKELEKDAIRKIAEREQQELKEKAEKQFFFKLSFDEGFIDYSVTRSEKQAGLKGVQDFYASVLQSLAQLKLEKDIKKDTEMLLFADPTKVTATIKAEGQGEAAEENAEATEINLLELLPEGFRGEIDELKKEMDDIIGLSKVKEYIFSLEEYYQVQKRRSEEGLKTGEVSKHMIFTGSPGTGKTTIARIISKYLKAIGVLSGGQLIEVSRADLVGRYVGHTAPLTNQVISSAIGGVLFIDEAYSLYRGKDDSFGLEAIDTLVKGIEDNRENLIVILAGYSNEMQEFLTSNSGLKSRFPNVINFPDYTGEELLLIAKSIAKSKGYVIDEGADPSLLAYFNAVQAVRAADAGNGRLARNKIEEAILNQSKRLVAEKDAELSLLISDDFDLTDIMSDTK